MIKEVPKFPRRDIVKRVARTVMLNSHQDALPINIDDMFSLPDYLLIEAEEAERKAGMKLPIEFWNNETVDAMTCYRAGMYVTLYKSEGRSLQRIRFTKAHELGHIALQHFTDFECPDSFSIYNSSQYQVLEREADMFAAELLAPTPVLKALSIVDSCHIQSICNISQPAAEFTIADMKMDLNVSEYDKNNVLRRFHRYIFTMEHLKRLNLDRCPNCKGKIEKGNRFCMVCGESLIGSNQGVTQRYHQPSLTRNGRLLYCNRCGNTQFRGGQLKCNMCDQPLYNKCFNLEHNNLLPGVARFCPQCAGVTTFFHAGIIKAWDKDANDIRMEDEYFSKSIEGIPLSKDWHYWVYEILIHENLPLYIELKDSVAILDENDLIIFSDVKNIPVEFIRDELKKYCELDVISISVDQGGVKYDF